MLEKYFLFSNKVKTKENISLVRNNETIRGNAETAKFFKNYFDRIVGNLDINRSLDVYGSPLRKFRFGMKWKLCYSF